MGKKVLLVDNDQLLLHVIGRKLEQEGHEVVTAEDGLTALSIIISFIPDIMFIDLIMPNIDGKKLCQILRKMPHMKGCYLVILSAAVTEMEFDFETVGADACIAKGDFAATIKYILSEIDKLDAPLKDKHPKRILGLENVYSRQMTKELLSQSRHLETFLESTTQGILEIFSEKIVFANSAAAALFGLPEEDLLTLYPPDLFNKKSRSQVEALLKTENDEPVEIGNKFSIMLGDRQVVVTKLPVKKSTATVIILITDVTERKQIEYELRQSQKMEAVGTLAGGIAHDFNNILAAIIGYAELSLVSADEATKLHANLENILKAGERATDLVKQILTFSRQAETEKKPLQMSFIVEEVLKLLRSSLPATIQVRQNFGDNLYNILSDPTQIHQIVMNLCTNAAHAMRKHGGILEVNLENVELATDLLAPYQDIPPGSYLKLTVSDTGQGMTPDIMDSIFDPYFTTKEHGQGTGMGLSVVHGIVKSNGGGITVQSEPEIGSTFNIYLPAIDMQVAAEPELLETLPTGNECILFVDDEPSLIEIIQEILGRLGYTVVSMSCSIEALDLFRSDPHKFDLVITDMTMPKMTGDILSMELIEIRHDIPIVLCTGYNDLISEQKAKEIGIREFVMKPLVTREVAHVIRKTLDQT